MSDDLRPHSCDNCDGIDPASCAFAPGGVDELRRGYAQRTVDAWRHYAKHWRERAEKAEADLVEQREVIDDQRRVNGEAISRAEQAEAAIARVREQHDVHSCERDGHIHRSTPNPCVNDGFCSCGQRSPCPTLAALDSPDVTP